VGVTLEQRGTERTVVVDGDLACPAMLVQLGAALRNLGYDDQQPIVIDLSASTGTSPAVTRLLGRFALVMSHRGVALRVDRVDLSGAEAQDAACAS
jgi:hypothetical protein